jgi:hypothetical protein
VDLRGGARRRSQAFWPLLTDNLAAKFGMVITGIFFRSVFYYHVGKGNLRDGAAHYGMFCNSKQIKGSGGRTA